jgi:hypothetical protein
VTGDVSPERSCGGHAAGRYSDAHFDQGHKENGVRPPCKVADVTAEFVLVYNAEGGRYAATTLLLVKEKV